MDIIKYAWSKACVGSPSFIWEIKLRKVRYELKEWVKTKFKSPGSGKMQLQTTLVDLQSKLEGEEITPLLIRQEKDLNQKILIPARGEEEDLRIKSRQLWLKGGDINTRYFHNQEKARLIFNMIKELRATDENKMIEQEEIKT